MKSSDAKQLPAVRLRALEPEDLDFLYRIENDEALWDCGTTNVPYSRQVLREYILSARNDIYTDGQVRLMAENEAGEVVGIGDFVNFDPRHQRAEIGLVVPVEYRRRGYGSAIVGRLIHTARHILHLHQVYVCVGVENKASIALFEKMGFATTARLTDWLCVGSAYQDALWMQRLL